MYNSSTTLHIIAVVYVHLMRCTYTYRGTPQSVHIYDMHIVSDVTLYPNNESLHRWRNPLSTEYKHNAVMLRIAFGLITYYEYVVDVMIHRLD